MDKYFLCLANSFKYGGRCIAGIELKKVEDHWRIVRKSDGTPSWIRPVSRYTGTGEIPNDIADCITVLSVVYLTGVEPCPEGVHSENVFYENIEITGSRQECTASVLDKLVCGQHNFIFGSSGNYVRACNVSSVGYSLIMVHLHDVDVYIKKKGDLLKPRMRFNIGCCEYDFPITDPEYWNSMKLGYNKIGKRKDVYAVLSLGLPYEEKHFKLVAALFDMGEDDLDTDMVRDITTEIHYTEELLQDNTRKLCMGEHDRQCRENDGSEKPVGNVFYSLRRSVDAIRYGIKRIIGRNR